VIVAAVVSWNTRDLLARCLESLRDDRVEVHVVDNGSSDGSPELVRERFGWATLHEPGNIGFGAAVNLVAERTGSPWLLAANADTAAEPGALDALVEAGARDRRAGAIAPRLVLPDGSTQHGAYPFPTLPFLALFNSGLAARMGDRLCLEGHMNPDRPRRVPWAIGAFLLIRRAAFDAAGGFDPAQWLYAEDLDLGWRMRRAGWHTRVEPRAIVHHASAASTAQAWGEDRVLEWQAATYDWLRRRRGPLRARAAYALNLAGTAVLSQPEWRSRHRRAWRMPPPRPALP
jgi:N-acetylglucosaminyl-diphospho-decaprenol L-rhamnosyltransferase